MSVHPNTILMAIFCPDDLPLRTMRAIREEYKTKNSDYVRIGNEDYNTMIMTDGNYDESYQISANEGDLIFFDFVTYGYGESVDWDTLQAQKNALDEWAEIVSKKYNCMYIIKVSANYW